MFVNEWSYSAGKIATQQSNACGSAKKS
jgi:hypothetical protein